MALQLSKRLVCFFFFLGFGQRALAPSPFYSKESRNKRSESTNLEIFDYDNAESRDLGEFFKELEKLGLILTSEMDDELDAEDGSGFGSGYGSGEGSGETDEDLMSGVGTSNTVESSGDGDFLDAIKGIFEFAEALGDLGSALQGSINLTISGSVLPENIIPTPPPVIDLKGPCASPYVEIAYKMCILPELEERLVWSDAVDYCRSRGLELAFDSVVIKARRYFNGALGEQGTRERWPIWVGGKKYTDEDGQGDWKWVDGSRVPEFLWTEGKPRSFEGQDTPDGLCMIMDGYQAYNTDSLPCHNRRRFVCQRPDY